MRKITPRGIRNRNPGNLEWGDPWQGLDPDGRRKDSRFAVFTAPAWGIRALARTLITYRDRHGITTIDAAIRRWAPPVENDTGSYVRAVASAVGVSPMAHVNFHRYEILRPMVEAIIRHENGAQPYSADVIEEGLRLAGVVKPGGAALVATPKAAQTATVTALTAGGTAAVVEGVNQLLPALQSFNAVASATGALPGFVRTAATIAVAVSVGASLYAWWRLRRARRAVTP